jgi:hypothetical protein
MALLKKAFSHRDRRGHGEKFFHFKNHSGNLGSRTLCALWQVVFLVESQIHTIFRQLWLQQDAPGEFDPYQTRSKGGYNLECNSF